MGAPVMTRVAGAGWVRLQFSSKSDKVTSVAGGKSGHISRSQLFRLLFETYPGHFLKPLQYAWYDLKILGQIVMFVAIGRALILGVQLLVSVLYLVPTFVSRCLHSRWCICPCTMAGSCTTEPRPVPGPGLHPWPGGKPDHLYHSLYRSG